MMWGLLFVFAGIILLLNNFGLVSWQVWDYITRFWPILIIITGIHVILGNSLISRLIMFMVTLTFFSLVSVYAFRHVGITWFNSLPPQLEQTLSIMEMVKP